jgi:dephospho-CoA kinase
MANKIFLLGRPGSGKSAAARYIQLLAAQSGWRIAHINDYKFLKQMYESESDGKSFQASERGGFDVLDFSVLDKALHMVEVEALSHCLCRRELVLLEFARNDYHAALRLFKRSFLQDAYLLFFHVDITTCAQRVQERTSSPETVDDHFISEEMLRSYYREDTGATMVARLVRELELDPSRVGFIENMGSWCDFYQQLREVMGMFMCLNEQKLMLPRWCAQTQVLPQVEEMDSSLAFSCPTLLQ